MLKKFLKIFSNEDNIKTQYKPLDNFLNTYSNSEITNSKKLVLLNISKQLQLKQLDHLLQDKIYEADSFDIFKGNNLDILEETTESINLISHKNTIFISNPHKHQTIHGLYSNYIDSKINYESEKMTLNLIKTDIINICFVDEGKHRALIGALLHDIIIDTQSIHIIQTYKLTSSFYKDNISVHSQNIELQQIFSYLNKEGI